MNERKLKLLLTLNTIGMIIALFWGSLCASGYRIEIEAGSSLEPIIGRGAVLIVATDPDTVNIGDLVTVLTGYGGSVTAIRKVVTEFYYDYLTDQCYVHLMDGARKTDWGWHPVESIRTKVVCILFRGFVGKGVRPDARQ